MRVKNLGVLFVLAGAAPGGPTPSPTQEKVEWIARAVPGSEQVRTACPKNSTVSPIMEAHLRRAGSVDEVKVVRRGGCRAVNRLIARYVRGWKFRPSGCQQNMWLMLTIFIDGP